jgi:hypothetical protein
VTRCLVSLLGRRRLRDARDDVILLAMRVRWAGATFFGISALLGGGGCERLNQAHCGNREGDATCAERGDGLAHCSVCRVENDGCGAFDPEPGCAAGAMPSEGTTGSDDVTSVVASGEDGTSSAVLTAGGESTGSESSSDGSSSGPPPAVCGNGEIEGEELCDGDNLTGQDCSAVGGAGPGLSCSSECQLDPHECSGFQMCGDGEIEGPEQCDGENLDDQTCATVSTMTGGTLTCSDCLFNITGCCREMGAACTANVECCSGSCTSLIPGVLEKKCQ